MPEPTAMELVLERLAKAEEQAEKVPVLENTVEMLQETVDRLINVVLQVGAGIIVSGVLAVVTALILKGVIG